jgi:hypothetical protein
VNPTGRHAPSRVPTARVADARAAECDLVVMTAVDPAIVPDREIPVRIQKYFGYQSIDFR